MSSPKMPTSPSMPGSPGQKIPLIIILGPTAVGKTALALSLAKDWNGEIVSADSRLFYRGMDIGTAKPSLGERNTIPHHLIDVTDPDATWSLSIFRQAADQAILDIHSRGRLALLVGGTGQYLQAVMDGWSPPPVAPDPIIRAELENRVAREGVQALHDELRMLDPLAADGIDPRNFRRTIRALEVIRLTGRSFSDLRDRIESPYRLLKIGLNRTRHALYDRIDARIEAMFANGLLDEVKVLLSKGYSPDLPSMTSIGYRECIQVLSGRISIEEAKARMRRATRIFVRRQANWFKTNDPTIHWFDASQDNTFQIDGIIRNFLANQ